ncbi:sigma-70 family RNA polymerase sigma factor [Streptomyces sp. NBC_01439]|uniref:sigma-70 family RNA polymerase sigma factor n=1 Tax=Streptomyces sp. NBC_01439 TaxID=2903867 RepID=UPI002E2A8B98|nr:sigma-70 family RNA polymerase sigma factor [Streptomyces sp. NBC_01439]
MENGEIIPLTAEQSDRLAVLFDAYGDRLVRFAYSRLCGTRMGNGEAWALAEDVVQSMWVRVARSGATDVLGHPEWSETEIRKVLFVRVKREIAEHFALMRSSETVVDWTEPATCNTLCPLLPNQCAWVDLPDYLARMVAALPEREREALLLKLDGMPHTAMGERLGCSASTADRLAKTAILLLQIDNPELSCSPVDMESLPEWEQRALAARSAAQREVLLRLDDVARGALLLSPEVPTRDIAKRLGVSRERVMGATVCAPVLRALGAADMERAA